MKRVFTAGTCIGFAAVFSLAAAAQSTQPPATATQPPATQPPPQTSGQMQERKDPAQPVTIVGCVQSEADYRRAHNLGRGGAVGTGAGVANEFVLINASMASGAAAGAAAGTATGTTGTAGATAAAGAGQAFEVSGENESQLQQYLGKRVEIVAKMKAAEKSAAGTTGGATAGTPPTGVDITSPDLKLKEVEIVSVKETTGSCPAK